MFELLDDHGVLLRRDVLAEGYDDNALARAVRGGLLVRIRQGAYSSTSDWRQWTASARHRALTHAVLRQYAEDSIAASHCSAVQLWGGPSYGLDLSRVHVTHLYGQGGRREAGLVHHRGECRVGDLSRDPFGRWLTAPARTVLDTATLAGVDAAVAVGDWFLHERLTTIEELHQHLAVMDLWPGTLRLRRVVSLVDPLAESVGESLSRLVFLEQRLPRPVLQWEVVDASGRLVARVDFAWPEHKLIVEFDGKQKYLALRRPGESIEEAVLREKGREDEVREITGCRVVRLVWADLARPQAIAARLRRAMAVAA